MSNILFYLAIVSERVTRYGLAWHTFETNKRTIFLATEVAFSYNIWSTKIASIIWFGSSCVDRGPAYLNNWHRLGALPFWVYIKVGIPWNKNMFFCLHQKNICKKNSKFLGQVWFASVLAPSSAVNCSPCRKFLKCLEDLQTFWIWVLLINIVALSSFLTPYSLKARVILRSLWTWCRLCFSYYFSENRPVGRFFL